MKVGIFSDTHDRLQETELVLDFFAKQKVNSIFHAGDWVTIQTVRLVSAWLSKTQNHLWGVLGNMDNQRGDLVRLAKKNPLFELSPEPKTIIQLDKQKFLLTHGDKPSLLEKIPPDTNYVISGHTHSPILEHKNNFFYINPGSVCGPRPPSLPGSRSFVILETQTNKAEISYLP